MSELVDVPEFGEGRKSVNMKVQKRISIFVFVSQKSSESREECCFPCVGFEIEIEPLQSPR